MKFADLGLSQEVLNAISEAGYEEPTPIQEKAIPAVLMGRDILGVAQTGTGKTAGFTAPMIDILASGRARARMPRSLILEPTRELAAQVAESFEKYSKYHPLKMALLIGGVSFGDQNQKLDRGVDVLIATPGRLLDHFERGKLMLNGVQVLVIDEADRMLDMGFIPDVERICKLMPQKHQTLFFSATMPPAVKKLSDSFLDSPAEISVAPPASVSETVKQFAVNVTSRNKKSTLTKLLETEPVKNAIIFCNRKRDVDMLAKHLKASGLDAQALHGDMNQSMRIQVLESFKTGALKLLVASDVAARGLDIPNMSHVFNYDIPMQAEDYVHRIGRTGRAGKEGTSYSLVTSDDRKSFDAVKALTKSPVEMIELGGRPAPQTKPEEEPEKPASKSQSRPRKKNPRPDESKQRAAPPEASSETKPREKSGEKSNNGRSGRNRDRGAPVVGLGDHVPAFLQNAGTRPKE